MHYEACGWPCWRPSSTPHRLGGSQSSALIARHPTEPSGKVWAIASKAVAVMAMRIILVRARSAPHRHKLSEETEANQAQPNAGHVLVEALSPSDGGDDLRGLCAVFEDSVLSERGPDGEPLIEVRLRRPPFEQDRDGRYAKHKANRIEPWSGQGVTHSILPPAAATSRMITSL